MYWRELLIRYIVKHVSSSCSGSQSITLRYSWLSVILGVPTDISTTCHGTSTVYY